MKHILRYLKGTINLNLTFIRTSNKNNNYLNPIFNIDSYCDASWGNDSDDQESTTGYTIKLNNNIISWTSKKQRVVSLSTCEAEYIAIASCIQDLTWIKQFLSEIYNNLIIQITLYCDNQAAIQISNNDTLHDRSKHIDIKHHYIRKIIKSNLLELKWIPTNEQQADIFTKSLGHIQFKNLTNKLINKL